MCKCLPIIYVMSVEEGCYDLSVFFRGGRVPTMIYPFFHDVPAEVLLLLIDVLVKDLSLVPCFNRHKLIDAVTWKCLPITQLRSVDEVSSSY